MGKRRFNVLVDRARRDAEALRQDQYLLLDSMLVAPVNPFVNGTKPWTEGQTGIDPKQPVSSNHSILVFLWFLVDISKA